MSADHNAHVCDHKGPADRNRGSLANLLALRRAAGHSERRTVALTDDDLDFAANPFQSLAIRYRADCEEQRNPTVNDALLATAEKLEQLAVRMHRFRSNSSEVDL